MRKEKRSTVIGAALIIFAVLLRLSEGWGNARAIALPAETTAPSLLRPTTGASWQETVSPSTPISGTTVPEPEPTVPTPVCAQFTSGDMAYVRLLAADDCPYQPDLEALLLQPLEWDLSGSEPTVLIIHTHASESYTRQPGQDYTEHIQYRTLDEAFNMVAVGDYLEQLLTGAGISVIHDRQIHDYPSYTASYENSRDAAMDYIAQYPTIQVVLDLHRDAVLLDDGSQFAPKITVDGKEVAQLMLVVGTNASGRHHPQWQDNLAMALKLQVLLERTTPGLTRRTFLRAQRFNHDLAEGAVIVEVGAAGNTLDEAMAAIPYLADALICLMHGANS